jgi:hypothetical protein
MEIFRRNNHSQGFYASRANPIAKKACGKISEDTKPSNKGYINEINPVIRSSGSSIHSNFLPRQAEIIRSIVGCAMNADVCIASTVKDGDSYIGTSKLCLRPSSFIVRAVK